MSDQENIINTEQPAAEANPVQEVPAPEKKEKKKRPFRLGFLTGMLVMLLLCVGTFFALLLTRRLYLSGGAGIVDAEVMAKAETIYAYLEENSIYDFDEEDLRVGMLDGLLEGTGDRYAEYYTADEIKELFADYNGDFCGIGILIRVNADGDYYLSGVYDDSPAKDAGFEEGDVLIAVDGETLDGVDKVAVTDKIRGPENTEVTVTVYRPGTDETLDLTAIRKKLKKIDVDYRMVTDTIGYIWIRDFDDVTTEQFEEAMNALKEQGMVDMVLDLRANTGGLLRVALEVARMLMPEGVIVTIENGDGTMKDYTCDGSREFEGRIVILTDGYTASSSEILTGALKDSGKAISIGTTTYGKGLVQDFFYLSDGSCIKMTTNEYYTPSGTAINGVGIAPDIEVMLDIEQYYEGIDNQLQAAIDYLEK
ncbi:MAG: S41 family peptidase [Lachnospiraceae bacterium]|nr:S41 family peptidase [Lachnospiraceae bacterium]